jgi:hypothetical protein
MPATSPLPALTDLLRAHAGAVRGLGDPLADTRRGAVYDHFAGAGALLFRREAVRDRNLFRSIYFDSAEGAHLAEIAERRFGVEAVVSTFGVGTATLSRPDASAGAGTVWAGTRISVLQTGTALATYAALSDVPVGPGIVQFDVPIRATTTGSGQTIEVLPGQDTLLRVDDPLWDTSLVALALACADGTDAESPAALRARARQAALDARRGYTKAIVGACTAQGAFYVAPFPSSALGPFYDNGLSWVYVGDAGGVGTDMLVRRCTIALESARVAGADLQVRPMAPSALSVRVTVTLWDDPASFNLADLTSGITAALVGAVASQASAYGYDLDAMAGACAEVSDSISAVDFQTPTASVTVATIVGNTAIYPATLARYSLAPNDVIVTFQGPS